jgi:hypothetical protein
MSNSLLPAAPPPPNMGVPVAARYLGISESFLNKTRTLGNGPRFLKIGARVVYSVDDLNQWLDQHRRRSTSDRGPDAALVGGDARRGIDSPHVRGDRS